MRAVAFQKEFVISQPRNVELGVTPFDNHRFSALSRFMIDQTEQEVLAYEVSDAALKAALETPFGWPLFTWLSTLTLPNV
jgi:hypothetical protein